MSEKRFYRHIGYYNNVADICELGGESAETIVGSYLAGDGAFYEHSGPHEPDCDFITPDDLNNEVHATNDGLYLVCDTTRTWNEFAEWKKRNEKEDWSNEEERDSNNFIDIYELYKIEIEGVTFKRRG